MPPTWNPRPSRCHRRAPRRAWAAARDASPRAPCRRRSAAPVPAIRSRRRPTGCVGSDGPRACSRRCGSRGSPPPRRHLRPGRSRTAAWTRGPWRRRAGRSQGSSARRSRTGDSRRRGPRAGRLRTSRRWGVPTRRPRSFAPSRRGTAVQALAVSRPSSRGPFYGGTRTANVDAWRAVGCTSCRSMESACGSTPSRARCSRPAS